MAKHIIHDVVFVEKVIDLPDHCPHCKADLTEHGSVNEWNWVDCSVKSHVEYPDNGAGTTSHDAEPPEPPHLEPEGYTETGDDYNPSAIWCTHCSTEIESGACVVLQADNPRSQPIRDVIDLES